MTIAVTWTTSAGVVLAADSAITTVNRDGNRNSESSAGRKVFPFPHIRCGAVAWGLMSIAGKDLWDWLPGFVMQCNAGDVNQLAPLLADELGQLLGQNSRGRFRIGIVLAGYVMHEDKSCPTVWHVHDGPSSVLSSRGECVDPARINANHDQPPEKLAAILNSGNIWTTRNGDVDGFANLEAIMPHLHNVMESVHGVRAPAVEGLQGLCDYVAFQIRLLTDMYRFSNKTHMGVGGRIDAATISPDGEVSGVYEYLEAVKRPRG